MGGINCVLVSDYFEIIVMSTPLTNLYNTLCRSTTSITKAEEWLVTKKLKINCRKEWSGYIKFGNHRLAGKIVFQEYNVFWRLNCIDPASSGMASASITCWNTFVSSADTFTLSLLLTLPILHELHFSFIVGMNTSSPYQQNYSSCITFLMGLPVTYEGASSTHDITAFFAVLVSPLALITWHRQCKFFIQIL